MKLTLGTIRSLDANKSYYLANSTGEIKEAGVWQTFKCLVGVGDGREKSAKLVAATATRDSAPENAAPPVDNGLRV